MLSIANRESVVSHKPVHVQVVTGSACNVRCKFCYCCHKEHYDPDMRSVMQYIEAVHDTLCTLNLTGGEPLVTKGGRELLKVVADRNYKFGIHLTTNAQYVDFDLLKKIDLVSVVISAHGATKAVYENIVEGGNIDTLIENIKRFVELKKEKPFLNIQVNYTVTSDNYMDIPEAVKMYQDFGCMPRFTLVLRKSGDPQLIRERKDLCESFLEKLDEGLSVAVDSFTRNNLLEIKNVMLVEYGKAREDAGIKKLD